MVAGEDTLGNYRSPIIPDPDIMPPLVSGANTGIGNFTSAPSLSDSLLRSRHAGNVRALPPPLPQAPFNNNNSSYYSGSFGGYPNSFGGYSGFGGGINNVFGSGAYGGYSNYGSGYGSYGYGGGMYNRYGMNAMDPESRFIQLAEASSRPTFQSIESLVSAVGNIAAMLDSTFFALTSSFRAILGVAANFGRLRGVFAQFWQTFAIFRGLTWIYKKLMYWLRLSKIDPSQTQTLKKAFAQAVNNAAGTPNAPPLPSQGQSPWPVLAFLSFIVTAPYLIMKLLGTVTQTAQDEARNPQKWLQPIETVALYDFQARNETELSLLTGQRVAVAPKEIQNTLGLINTGWALATIDYHTSGIVPINYVKSPKEIREDRQKQERMQQHLTAETSIPEITENVQPDLNNIFSKEYASTTALTEQAQHKTETKEESAVKPQPELMNLSRKAFAPPPIFKNKAVSKPEAIEKPTSEIDMATQPIASEE